MSTINTVISRSAEPSPLLPTRYRADIDGLRCWAVLSVVGYHAGIPGISGGFAGVDVFFVVSGFLITSLVREQIIAGNFALRDFYARRARRLFPALFAMLAASSVAGWWLLLPDELEDFGESLATASAFSSNILFWSEAGYFDGPSDFKPLLHTWSLAVEEHYYLAFPALLLAIRHHSATIVLGVVFALLVISLALQLFYITGSPDAAFFLSPNRFWELLIGSATAIALRPPLSSLQPNPLASSPRNPFFRELLALIGVSCLIYSTFGFDSETRFPGIAALLPCAGTALLLATGAHGTSLVNRALEWRPFVVVGLISYSLYLWHWPILVYQKHLIVRPPTAPDIAAALALSGLAAWASWRFIERPFHTPPIQRQRHSSKPISDKDSSSRTTLMFSAAVLTVFIAIGITLDLGAGFPQRLPENVAHIASFADDKPQERKRCTGLSAEQIHTTGLCEIGAHSLPTKNQTPDFLVWGDSHAMVLIPTFAQAASVTSRVGLNATRNGCAPLLGAYRPATDNEQECVAFNAAVLEIAKQTPSIKTVILVARWAIYLEGTRYKHESGKPLLLIDPLSLEPSRHESILAAKRSLERTIAALQKLGKNVVVFAGVPEVGWDVPKVLAKSSWRDRDIDIAPTREEHKTRQRTTTALLSGLTPMQALIVHPDTLLCTGAHCRIQLQSDPLYVDEDHLSSIGARQLMPIVIKSLHQSRPPKT